MLSFESRFQAFEFYFRLFDIDQAGIQRRKNCLTIKRLLAYAILLFFITVYGVRIIASLVFINDRDFTTRHYIGDNFGITVVGINSVTRVANAILYLIWSLHASIIIITIIFEKKQSRKSRLSWIKLIDAKLMQNPELLRMTNQLTFYERHKSVFLFGLLISVIFYVILEVYINYVNMRCLENKIITEANVEYKSTISLFWLISNSIMVFFTTLINPTALVQCLFICSYFGNLLNKIIKESL